MKKNIFVKFPMYGHAKDEEKKEIKLVNVCAWCPKENYPDLEDDEEYTHGLCEKHYVLLRDQTITDR